ncbi:YfcC family protein [Haloglycomyces albus]|uniref:YfcC family protein n=1 Tax=Haloglycomyces albus TaxID=526067 RepID=UPI00046D3B21|nr:Na+/H+ antiporter NhaC family protein [Haloglycomyces albus]
MTTLAHKKKFTFPTAYTVLVAVTLIVWAAAFAIPPGQYELDADGRPIQGTYQPFDVTLGIWERLEHLVMSPINGLYGLHNADSGLVSPTTSGELYGSAGIFFYVLAVGAYITVVMKTGALERGISRLSHRLRHRSLSLIVVIMAVFALAGTVEGFAEETLGFYVIIVPLILGLGYDRMTAVGVIIAGAGIGVLSSTVNPFATGIASSIAGVSVGDGILLRAVMWLVLVSVVIAYVLRYATRVKRDPERSLSGYLDGDRDFDAANSPMPEPPTARQRVILWLVAATFAFMIYSIVPWASVIEGPQADSYAWQLDWYFPQLSALFLIMACVTGAIAGLGEKGTTDGIITGFGDFIGAGLIIILARGVTTIMTNTYVTDTVLHSLENVVSGTDGGVFAMAVFAVNIPISFLVPSSSGAATLVMPIMAPLADFAGVERSLAVTAWQAASGWVNLITPTSAVVMGGLALAKVRYDRYLRFVLPLMGILFLAVCAFLAAAAWIA